MDGFYEDDDRILGHAADPSHRSDIRRTSRRLAVRAGDRVVADTSNPLVLYESGLAPRWYVPRADVVAEALTPPAWSYRAPLPETAAIAELVSFEPDKVAVTFSIDEAGALQTVSA
jgi:uncharacterized protein (DUF427 family)